MKEYTALGALRAVLMCGAVALQVACVGGGGSTPAGGGGGGGGGNTTADASGTADTAPGGADTATGADTTAGGDTTTTDTAGSDGTATPADTQAADGTTGADVLSDGTASDSTTSLDGKADSTTTSDVNLDVVGTNDCCTTSDKPACKDPAIVACVCAKDKFCCENKWDSICVGKVNSLGCGKCSSTTTDAGPTDTKDVDFSEVSGSQDCCTESKTPGCKDKTVQLCVCALDKFCCETAWDNYCVSGVVSKKCGTCAGSSDASTSDNVGTDTKDGTSSTDSTTVEVSVDSGSTAAKGCTSAADQAFLAKLATDAKLASEFSSAVTSCSLSCVSKPNEAEASACTGKCLADKGVSEACGGCYGLLGYCTFANCVQNPAEAATANCIAAPTGSACKACMDKYQCTQKSDNCKAGK